MKRVKKPVFFVVLILILALAYSSIFGVYGQRGDFKITYIKGAQDIRWGIDIRGGVEATFSPADGIDATREQMDSAKSIIELRLVAENITDYELYTDYQSNRIIVRFPWRSDETEYNPEEAIQELSATALLTFREGAEYTNVEYAADGSPIFTDPAGVTATNIILEGSDIISATSGMYQNETTQAYEYKVALEFSAEGTEKFAEATERLVGGQISIWMDNIMFSSPTVQSAITDGRCVIEGDFTASEAADLAARIQAGALPFALETSNFGSIHPTLGLKSLEAMLIAGIIAFAIVSLLMLVVYRLPGFVAIFALLGQIAIMFATVSGYLPFINSFTMTLPGIAGMILSIGMGVDANIISSSRIAEELRNGKTLDGAVQKGYENSFSAVFDGNVTMIIVAMMLIAVFGPMNILSWIFGASTTGAIYSFGYTLLMGVIGNFVMGMTAARLMVKSLSGYKPLRKKWLYGGAHND